MDPSLSNSLAELAARIRAEHDGAKGAIKRGVEHAIAAGELLIEAKEKLQHGQWLPWLEEHCGMSERSARRYMRVAKNKDKLGENGHVSDLSLRGALDTLTTHLPDDEPEAAAAAVLSVLSVLRENFDRLPLSAVEALKAVAAKAMAEAKEAAQLSSLDAREYVEENPSNGYACLACTRELDEARKGFHQVYIIKPHDDGSAEIVECKRGIREDFIEVLLNRETDGRLSPGRWTVSSTTNRVFNAYADIYDNPSKYAA
jgi:hypothetical protein